MNSPNIPLRNTPFVKRLQTAVQNEKHRHAQRENERQLSLLYAAAKNLRNVIVDTAMQAEIREGTAIAAWRFCATRFADRPRDVFVSLFGPDLLRWIDDRPASAGRLDSYLKGSN